MRKRDGFTLVEASVAMSIFVIGITLIIGGYMYLQKNSQEQLIQDELEMDLNMAVQRLQAEMRLSDLSQMTFYPPSSQRYIAMSFPLLDPEDPSRWGRTVIYHTTPEKDRLLRTEIDDFLEDVGARQEQLKTVVEAGEGGDDAKTITLFEQVLDWSIVPLGSSYDGYIDSTFEQIDPKASLGRGIVDPGDNTLTFTVTGKDDRSGGYKIGLDTLRASPSGLLREAEDQIKNDVGGALTKEYNASGLWSGYHQLSFDATAPGETFSVSLYNDGFEDTNFDLSGSIKSNVTVGLPDNTRDMVLHLEGNTTNWTASAQTGDDVGIGTGSGVDFRGAALRTIIRGAPMANGSLLGHNGDLCRVAFAAGSNALHIVEAYIDEVIDSYDVVPDTVGRPTEIRFSSGSGYKVPAGTNVWSEYFNYPIKYNKSYAVTLWVADNAACQPKSWVDQNGVTGTYVITNTLSYPVSSGDLVLANWSANAEVIPLPETIAVEMLHTMYPSEGTYISPVVDTKIDSPEYERIDWTADCPSGTSVSIYVRSGSDPEMNDAPAWPEVLPEPSPGTPAMSWKQYVQYKAVLSSDGFNKPKLRDVALKWLGETKIVEVGGTFINGRNYGQFEVELNGQKLTSPLRVSLVVKKDIQSMNNETKTIEAREVFELAPRNTRRIR